jgi:DnaJ-class molecular chaperone
MATCKACQGEGTRVKEQNCPRCQGDPAKHDGGDCLCLGTGTIEEEIECKKCGGTGEVDD